MKLAKYFFLFFTGILLNAQSVKFDNYFTDQTMRIDYYHIGDATTETITLDHVKIAQL